MKNFNNEQLDKYQKMAKNALSKFKKNPQSSFKFPKIKISLVLGTILTSGISYIAYRIYDYKRYCNQHYIDIIERKKKISNQIKLGDLFQKIRNMSIKQNINQATQNYANKLKQEFQVMIQKIQEKKLKQSLQQNISQENKENKKFKKAQQKHFAEIILSKNQKSKLNFGYFFKLHTKKHVSSIRNTSYYIKKTYNIPIMIFDVPFFAKKKQQIKKIGKKSKLSETLNTKQHFDLSSQCQSINYWNLLTLENTVKRNKQQIKDEQEKTLENSNSGQKDIIKNISQVTQRQQLLFDCRQRIKKIQNEFVQRLKQDVEEKWKIYPKDKNFNKLKQFTITTWDQMNKQKEN